MTTPTKGYEFKVNGEQFTSERPDLTALEILTVAKQGGAIPNDPEGYILEGQKARYQGSERVNLEEDNVFFTVPIGPTPYAWPEIGTR